MKCPKCQTDNPADSKYCKECATPIAHSEIPQFSVTKTLETSTETLGRGTLFAGRYEVIEALGIGGMGEVYRVEDKKVGQEVALKLIKPQIASNRKTIERFRQEMKTARMISHRNVCRMFDLGEDKGTYFITMEYVAGEDLKSFLRRSKQLALGTSITIAKQVCEGLAEAHRLGVVHRDLKPGNIMIDKDGNARIMDFGIARSLEAKGMTGEGVTVGTPEYMSPEQVEGKEVDRRSDIYSFGIILYEMVTGQRPFVGETAFDIALKQKSVTPRSPRELNPQIPEELNVLILKCLEKKKENRPPQAEALLADLIKIETGLTTASREVIKRASEIQWKNVARYGGAALFLVILIIAALTIFKSRGGPRAIQSIIVLPLKDLSPGPRPENFADGMHAALIDELNRIKPLRVISRTTAISFKDTKKKLPEIAKEANADAVIEGSVSLAGNQVIINVQLREGRTEKNLWSNEFERDYSGVFILHKEIAQAVASEIKIAMTPEERKSLGQTRPVVRAAMDAYLKARADTDLIKGKWRKALEYYEEAIKIDPNFVQAYVGLVGAYETAILYNEVSPTEAWTQTREAARKLLELDEGSAIAQMALAKVKFWFEWDWEGAEKAFNRALELEPNNVDVLQGLCFYWGWTGRRDKAIEGYKKCMRLEPSRALEYRQLLFGAYSELNRLDEATSMLAEITKFHPDADFASSWPACLFYARKGMKSEALRVADKLIASGEPSLIVLMNLGCVYEMVGDKNAAKKILDDIIELSKQTYVDAWGIASLAGQLKLDDLAFEWLNKGYNDRSPNMSYVPLDTSLVHLHSDPRFIELMRKMGLDFYFKEFKPSNTSPR